MARRTKIVATLGPATDDPTVLRNVIAAGVDGVRVSLAHGDVSEARARIVSARAASEEANRPVGVLVDLPGPKVRVTEFSEGGAWLTEGERVELRGGDGSPHSTAERIYVESPGLVETLEPGDRVALGDGGVALFVAETSAGRAVALVHSGGHVQGRPGFHVPTDRLSAETPTPDDLAMFDRVADAGIDAVAVSFVRSGADVERASRELAGSGAMIVAKIETAQAVEALDEVIAVADGVMVARGDLGVRCQLEDVPHYQKRIIRKGVHYGLPVITATQMLESMVHAPVPTRAEVTDVANAVFDGTSALMLSGETAIGRNPALVVATMARIAARADAAFDHETWRSQLLREQPLRMGVATPAQRVTEATSAGAWRAALDAGAKLIIACTVSGMTARSIARFRPPMPILAVTTTRATLHRLAFAWGVEPVLGGSHGSTEEVVWFAVEKAVHRGLVEAGDIVAVLAGDPLDPDRSTDTLRMVRVR